MNSTSVSFRFAIIVIFGMAIAGCSPFDSAVESLSLGGGRAADYIVVLDEPTVSNAALAAQSASFSGRAVTDQEAVVSVMGAIATTHDLETPSVVFSRVLHGGVYRMTETQAQQMREDSRVKYVERDRRVSISANQSFAPWGLDRLDQENLPLDRSYQSPDSGAIVNAYVIDTGINTGHTDFQGRATHGFDFVDSDSDVSDCNGHGTHVAGTIGGSIHGVAKSAKIVGVRVLDCQGSGSFSGVISGIEWVTANHIKPAVANMSLGGGASQAIDDAIRASISAGVTYVVAAGNENQDACLGSPARVPTAITVGSTTNQDVRSSFSNFGTCVDIFAPGSDILSTWHTSTSATQTISGTSMASPHVAGVVALMLARSPQMTPLEVTNELILRSRTAKLTNIGVGSLNRLLATSFLLTSNPPPPPPIDPIDGEPGVTELKSGLPIAGVEGKKGEEKFFMIRVPPGTASVEVRVSGGTGDIDLYTRVSAKPSAIDYDCRPYSNGNSEICTHSASSFPAAGGKIYIRLHGYAAYSGVVLSAIVKSGVASGPCSNCDLKSGTFASKGSKAEPWGEFVSNGKMSLWLEGPSGTDFDLYLYRKNGTQWTQVASSNKSASQEFVTYDGTAGTFKVEVRSYNGTGAYNVWKQ